jgi:phage I-like protein
MGDNEDGPMRVVKLINVAITNLPATKGQKPMVASETKTMPGPGRNEDTPDMSTELFTLLGAKTEAEAMINATRWKEHETQLLSATGKDTVADALKEIATLKEQSAQASTLATKVTELERELSTSKHEGLITQLHDEGKLAEAAFGWARTLSFEQLEQHGKLTQPDPKKTGAHDPADGDNETVALTDAQKQAAKLQGFTEEEYIEAVKADAAAEAKLRNGNALIVRRAD